MYDLFFNDQCGDICVNAYTHIQKHTCRSIMSIVVDESREGRALNATGVLCQRGGKACCHEGAEELASVLQILEEIPTISKPRKEEQVAELQKWFSAHVEVFEGEDVWMSEDSVWLTSCAG